MLDCRQNILKYLGVIKHHAGHLNSTGFGGGGKFPILFRGKGREGEENKGERATVLLPGIPNSTDSLHAFMSVILDNLLQSIAQNSENGICCMYVNQRHSYLQSER